MAYFRIILFYSLLIKLWLLRYKKNLKMAYAIPPPVLFFLLSLIILFYLFITITIIIMTNYFNFKKINRFAISYYLNHWHDCLTIFYFISVINDH